MICLLCRPEWDRTTGTGRPQSACYLVDSPDCEPATRLVCQPLAAARLAFTSNWFFDHCIRVSLETLPSEVISSSIYPILHQSLSISKSDIAALYPRRQIPEMNDPSAVRGSKAVRSIDIFKALDSMYHDQDTLLSGDGTEYLLLLEQVRDFTVLDGNLGSAPSGDDPTLTDLRRAVVSDGLVKWILEHPEKRISEEAWRLNQQCRGGIGRVPLHPRPTEFCKTCSKLSLSLLLHVHPVAAMTDRTPRWRRYHLEQMCEFRRFLAARLPFGQKGSLSDKTTVGTCLAAMSDVR